MSTKSKKPAKKAKKRSIYRDNNSGKIISEKRFKQLSKKRTSKERV